MEVQRPPETLRATVLGASSQTVTLSGSTIWAERHLLPIKNMPVVHPRLSVDALESEQIRAAVREAITRWEVNPREEDVAIVAEVGAPLDFARLQKLARGLADYARLEMSADRPLILIMGRDYAQSLGQTIKAFLPDKPLLSIDQVGLDEGDYIDIGTPLMDGRVVPLSVKTLVFYR
jgi:ethanolamine utilization protein EutA